MLKATYFTLSAANVYRLAQVPSLQTLLPTPRRIPMLATSHHQAERARCAKASNCALKALLRSANVNL